eukprot:8511837-Lingulodinium_polyedra.AAC.1
MASRAASVTMVIGPVLSHGSSVHEGCHHEPLGCAQAGRCWGGPSPSRSVCAGRAHRRRCPCTTAG